MEDLLQIVDSIVSAAKPGEEVEAVVMDSSETEVRVYEGEVESHTSAVSQGLGIRVIKDQCQGFAYTGTLDPKMTEQTLLEARANADFGTPDEYLALAEPDGVEYAELDLFADFNSNSDEKIAMASKLEAEVKAGHKSIFGVETAEYGDVSATAAVASTTGIRRYSRESFCHLAAYALAREGEDTQSGFGYSVGRKIQDLDLDKAAKDAVDRSTRLLGAVKPKSMRTDIILDPWVTAQFLSIIGGTLSGEAVLKGRSLFADRIGESVAADCVELTDNPTNPKSPSATEIDGEGLATRPNELIKDGILQQFLHNSYTARRMGTISTGSAVRGYSSTPGVGCQALALKPGSKSQEELLKEVSEGVLIQGVSGLHSGVNPVSGDFSTGAEGLMVKGGELAEPVREFTVASTLQKMLLEIQAVGSDLEWLPMGSAGMSLWIKNATISGD